MNNVSNQNLYVMISVAKTTCHPWEYDENRGIYYASNKMGASHGYYFLANEDNTLIAGTFNSDPHTDEEFGMTELFRIKYPDEESLEEEIEHALLESME